MEQDPTAPHWHDAALLTIDLQRDFSLRTGTAFVEGTDLILPAIERLVAAFRRARRPIFHAVRLYAADGSDAERCRRLAVTATSIVRPGTAGSALVAEIDSAATHPSATQRRMLGSHEWMFYKPRWSAFYGTELEVLLKAQDVNTLVFAGCNFPNCPRSSIYDASSRDFRLVITTDAISGLYDKALQELRGIGAALMTAADIDDWLRDGDQAKRP